MPGRVNGFSLAYTAAGGVVLWSGIRNTSISATFRSLLGGKLPAPGTGGQVITSSTAAQADVATGTSVPGVTAGIPAGVASPSLSGQQALQQAATAHGWGSGAEWNALVYVEMREAGFSATAKNPSSGALGLAQALGHGTSGTAGTLGNEYGGYGLSDAQAQAANSGNAYYQAVWMCNYIAAVYGDPVAAAAHERADSWY